MEKLRFRAVIFDIPGYNGLNSNRDCNMKEVGKRLKALRESIGISQVKMAEAIGNCSATMRITLMCRWTIFCPDGQAPRRDIRV